MDMTVVLGIFTFFYFVTLFLMCFYRTKINVRLCNTIFIVSNFLAYSAWTYAAYQKNWLDGGWLTLGNISPMTFTIILLTPFMNERIRDYAYSSIAFLNVGMFFAMIISPEYDYVFNFSTEATFIYTTEAVCHLICALYGIFLVLSKQVKVDFKRWIKSVVFTLSIITFAVVLNFIYHRSYFGMDPYGNAKIYMLDLFDGFWPTLIAYYFGVIMVLTVGYQCSYMLEKATAKLFEHEHVGIDFSVTEDEADDITKVQIAEEREELSETENQENKQVES